MARTEIVEYVLNLKGDADRKASTLSGTVAGVTKVAGLATAAIGVMGAATVSAAVEIKQLTDEVAGALRELEQLSIQSDLSVETLAGLRLAASAAGRELNDIIPDDLSERMFDAVHGGGEMAEVFQRWGIALTDANGAMRSANDVLPEVIESLTAMENKTEASALASILLGDNGRRMLATFDSREGFEAFVGAADEFGITSGKRAAETTREWAAASAELTVAIDTLKAAIVDEFGGDVVRTMALVSQSVVALSLVISDLIATGAALNDLRGSFLGPLPNVFKLHDAASDLRVELGDMSDAWTRAGDKMERFRDIGKETVDILADLEPAKDFLSGTGTGLFNVAQDQRTFATPRAPKAPRASKSTTADDLEPISRAIRDVITTESVFTREELRLRRLDAEQQAAALTRDLQANADTAALLGGGGVNSVVGGALGGLAGGPVGLLLSALPDILTSDGGVGGLALDLQQQVIDLLDALPETLTQLLSADFLTQLLANGVEIFARTFVLLPFEIGAAVAEGLVALFQDLPQAFAEALAGLLDGLTEPFRGDRGRFLGTALGADAAGDRSFLGVALNNFAAGTPRIRRSGAAFVHEDEAIIPAGMARQMRSGGMGGGVQFGGVTIMTDNPRAIVEQLQRSLGSYGDNLTLDPVST